MDLISKRIQEAKLNLQSPLQSQASGYPVGWTISKCKRVRSCILNLKWESSLTIPEYLHSARWPRLIAERWIQWAHPGQVESEDSGNIRNRITTPDSEYLRRRKNAAKKLVRNSISAVSTWAAQPNHYCLPTSDIRSGLVAVQPAWLPVSLILWNLVCWKCYSVPRYG